MQTSQIGSNGDRNAVPSQNRRMRANLAARSRRIFGTMDMALFLLVLLLLAFGLVMVFSASYANALYYEKNSLLYIQKQGLWAIAGLIGMLLVSRIDYRLYRKFVIPIFLLGIILLIVVLGFETAGVRRWIPIGTLATFQPSEYMKFALAVTFSALIAKNYDKMGTFKYGMMPFMLILGVVIGLMMLEPHLSGSLIMAGIGGTLMFIGGTKMRYVLFIMVPIGVLGIIAIIMLRDVSYMTSRIENWLDPFSNASIRGAVWQTCQSLIAIGSGGVMGVGLGASRQKYLYLPEPQNDFIFAIVCEELGLIGAIVVIALFVLFVYRGFSIANKAPDKFGALLAIGITMQIGLQATLNIGVVTNAIPNTGISLPFFSYGGTALMMQMLQIGVLLNISRHSAIEKL